MRIQEIKNSIKMAAEKHHYEHLAYLQKQALNSRSKHSCDVAFDAHVTLSLLEAKTHSEKSAKGRALVSSRKTGWIK